MIVKKSYTLKTKRRKNTYICIRFLVAISTISADLENDARTLGSCWFFLYSDNILIGSLTAKNVMAESVLLSKSQFIRL